MLKMLGHTSRVLFYQDKGKDEKAIAEFNQAIQRVPKNANSDYFWQFLGLL
ncbi:MAG: hypothetical protein O4750_05875 [Trichodesmium sp. St18_bin3_1_1]|nr:hypothetical protein [Trichodesmium sp. St18_bin3_1_1]MDE5095740.1 hypothetical protein [Trichodesmium sp. St11_bin5]